MIDILDFGPVEDKMQGIIKVIGVGGGGCNAVRNMYDENISGVTLAVCNTDSKSLAPSPVPVKILLGEGLGAGGKPEVGRTGERLHRSFQRARRQRLLHCPGAIIITPPTPTDGKIKKKYRRLHDIKFATLVPTA